MVFLISVLRQLSSRLIEIKSHSCFYYKRPSLAKMMRLNFACLKRSFCNSFNCSDKLFNLDYLSQDYGFFKYSFKTNNQ